MRLPTALGLSHILERGICLSGRILCFCICGVGRLYFTIFSHFLVYPTGKEARWMRDCHLLRAWESAWYIVGAQ